MTEKWHQLVTTDKFCPKVGCGSNNVQFDKREPDVLVCRTCDLRYVEATCPVCESNGAYKDMHKLNAPEVCKNCGGD